MKILRFDGSKTGILIDGNQVLDVGANIGALRAHDYGGAALLESVLPNGGVGSWVPMIESWGSVGKVLHGMAALAPKLATRPLAGVHLEAPMTWPGQRIIALGGNVATHMAAAMRQISANKNITADDILDEKRKQGLQPWGFMVLPETVVGPGASVAPPAGVQKFDYESEVAVYLHAGGRNLKASDVQIWGYSCYNDLSIRDGRLGIGLPLHRGAFSWAIEKNFDTGNALGPWVVVDEDRDPMKLKVKMRVSGVTRQDWSTAECMYSFAETAEFVSKYLKLGAGDLICSGTGHGTAAEYGKDNDRWLKPGDRLEVEVEGCGILENKVVAW